MNEITINLDFDGTCVTHEFPSIGQDIGAVPVLKELVANGHKLILFTMRSDIENPVSDEINIIPQGGFYLSEAVNWFRENEIELYGIQTNPTQHNWTTSPKSYAQIMIDDSALGCPLVYDAYGEHRPFVDWVRVRQMLVELGCLPA